MLPGRPADKWRHLSNWEAQFFAFFFMFWITCPSNAATLAVLMMQPLCPSPSASFFPIAPAARRITLKVPAMFTWTTHTDKETLCTPAWWTMTGCFSCLWSFSYINNTLEVFQAVRDVLLEVVGLNSHSNAGTVNCQVQLPKLLSSQRHCWLDICLWCHLENITASFKPMI